MTIIEKIYPYLWVFMMFSIVFYLILLNIGLSFLKTNHFEVWSNLGKPTLFFNSSIKNSIDVILFIFNKSYKKINDEKVNMLFDRVFVSAILSLIIVITTFSFPKVGAFLN